MHPVDVLGQGLSGLADSAANMTGEAARLDVSRLNVVLDHSDVRAYSITGLTQVRLAICRVLFFQVAQD